MAGSCSSWRVSHLQGTHSANQKFMRCYVFPAALASASITERVEDGSHAGSPRRTRGADAASEAALCCALRHGIVSPFAVAGSGQLGLEPGEHGVALKRLLPARSSGYGFA